jgi:hypothetical protein
VKFASAAGLPAAPAAPYQFCCLNSLLLTATAAASHQQWGWQQLLRLVTRVLMLKQFVVVVLNT